MYFMCTVWHKILIAIFFVLCVIQANKLVDFNFIEAHITQAHINMREEPEMALIESSVEMESFTTDYQSMPSLIYGCTPIVDKELKWREIFLL